MDVHRRPLLSCLSVGLAGLLATSLGISTYDVGVVKFLVVPCAPHVVSFRMYHRSICCQCISLGSGQLLVGVISSMRCLR